MHGLPLRIGSKTTCFSKAKQTFPQKKKAQTNFGKEQTFFCIEIVGLENRSVFFIKKYTGKEHVRARP